MHVKTCVDKILEKNQPVVCGLDCNITLCFVAQYQSVYNPFTTVSLRCNAHCMNM